jgi:hypothetical protein
MSWYESGRARVVTSSICSIDDLSHMYDSPIRTQTYSILDDSHRIARQRFWLSILSYICFFYVGQGYNDWAQ